MHLQTSSKRSLVNYCHVCHCYFLLHITLRLRGTENSLSQYLVPRASKFYVLSALVHMLLVRQGKLRHVSENQASTY